MLQRILCRRIYVCGKIRKAFWRVEKAKRHETFEKCKEKSVDCGNKELITDNCWTEIKCWKYQENLFFIVLKQSVQNNFDTWFTQDPFKFILTSNKTLSSTKNEEKIIFLECMKINFLSTTQILISHEKQIFHFIQSQYTWVSDCFCTTRVIFKYTDLEIREKIDAKLAYEKSQ